MIYVKSVRFKKHKFQRNILVLIAFIYFNLLLISSICFAGKRGSATHLDKGFCFVKTTCNGDNKDKNEGDNNSLYGEASDLENLTRFYNSVSDFSFDPSSDGVLGSASDSCVKNFLCNSSTDECVQVKVEEEPQNCLPSFSQLGFNFRPSPRYPQDRAKKKWRKLMGNHIPEKPNTKVKISLTPEIIENLTNGTFPKKVRKKLRTDYENYEGPKVKFSSFNPKETDYFPLPPLDVEPEDFSYDPLVE